MAIQNPLFFFFVFFLSFSFLLLFSSSKTHPSDIKALRRLKHSVNPSSMPPSSCLSTWNFTHADPCDSLFSADLFTCGFCCDSSTHTTSSLSLITEVTLDNAGYSGSLSSSVWSFKALRILDISYNSFSGSIPELPSEKTASLPTLRRVALSKNQFRGEIPSGVFNGKVMVGLEELFLDGNEFTGEIPASVAGIESLRRLELEGNHFSGIIPSDLGSLKNLYVLDASDNILSGPIPAKLPPSLVELSMRNNLLEGEIPMEIGNLGYVQVIDLSMNKLSGSIPSTLLSHPSLQQLVLTNNKLSSISPPEFGGGGRSGLIELDLSKNQISGMLPLWLVEMPMLSSLSLENNGFTGMIPWVYASKPLGRLMLAGNYLYGPIPFPLTTMKEGSSTVSLADNCLFRCPEVFFFCQGGEQKPMKACREVNPFIP